MARTKYSIPVDVLRRVDASIEQEDIGTNFSLPVSTETVTAHIEGVEDEFERRAIELTDQSKDAELHEGVEREFGWTVYLDEMNVKPLDPSQGDKVEVRTGEETFADVTDEAFLDEDQGVVEVDNRVIRTFPFYPEQTNYRFRVSYRYGGDSDDAGETVTTGSVPDTESAPFTIGVEDAEEIPVGSIILVGGSEYALVSGRDTTADTLTIGQRALRGTSATSVESGDEVNFMPLNIRDAISAKVATRLLRQDDFQDFLNEGTGDNIDNQQKIDDLEAEFEATIGRYTTSSGYI